MAGLVAVQLKQKRLKNAAGPKGDQIIDNEPEDAKVYNNLPNLQTYSWSAAEVKLCLSNTKICLYTFIISRLLHALMRPFLA